MNDNLPLNKIRVAFQGERGAFSEEAAQKLLGDGIETVPCRTFEDMFEAVSNGNADCSATPIENSLAGSVHKNYDLLLEHDLTIAGEVNLKIIHNLIAPQGIPLNSIKRVYSHPVALAQCTKFFRANPQYEAAPAYDTAGSVKMIVEHAKPGEAAIAGRPAAEVYGAQILIEGIEDNPENYTRFLLLARPDHISFIKLKEFPETRKTSIVFRVANKAGALFKSLAVFALRDIDLCKIESRPIEGRPWEYSFYLDFMGDHKDPVVERALSHLEELAESVRVLGSYSSAGTFDS